MAPRNALFAAACILCVSSIYVGASQGSPLQWLALERRAVCPGVTGGKATYASNSNASVLEEGAADSRSTRSRRRPVGWVFDIGAADAAVVHGWAEPQDVSISG
jgi:hypothetical protein